MSRGSVVAALGGILTAGATVIACAADPGFDAPTDSGGDATAPPPTAGPQEGPTTVTPRPGMRDVRAVSWHEATALDERTVRVRYTSGVEPCYVLDHVTVDYHPEDVVITLYQGSDPAAEDQACIQIAVEKVTEVALDEPLRGRTIVDGAQPR